MAQGTKVKKRVISGFAFHCHHDKLVEFVTDYQERVDYIKHEKPIEEQKTRLGLFKMIPTDRLPDRLYQAGEAYAEARADLGKAWADLDKTWANHDKAEAGLGKAWVNLDKAEADLDKAEADPGTYFIELHNELCPDCPWDGKTIFPGKGEEA